MFSLFSVPFQLLISDDYVAFGICLKVIFCLSYYFDTCGQKKKKINEIKLLFYFSMEFVCFDQTNWSYCWFFYFTAYFPLVLFCLNPLQVFFEGI